MSAEDLDRIATANERLQEATVELQAAVDAAHERGHSWAEIGAVMGMKRQSAWERFRHDAAG